MAKSAPSSKEPKGKGKQKQKQLQRFRNKAMKGQSKLADNAHVKAVETPVPPPELHSQAHGIGGNGIDAATSSLQGREQAYGKGATKSQQKAQQKVPHQPAHPPPVDTVQANWNYGGKQRGKGKAGKSKSKQPDSFKGKGKAHSGVYTPAPPPPVPPMVPPKNLMQPAAYMNRAVFLNEQQAPRPDHVRAEKARPVMPQPRHHDSGAASSGFWPQAAPGPVLRTRSQALARANNNEELLLPEKSGNAGR